MEFVLYVPMKLLFTLEVQKCFRLRSTVFSSLLVVICSSACSNAALDCK